MNRQTQFRIGALGISGIADPFAREKANINLGRDADITGVRQEASGLLSSLGVGSMDEAFSMQPQTDEQQAQIDRLRILKDEEQAIYEDAARAIKETERRKVDTIAGYGEELAGTMGSIAGDLATVMGKAGEEGFEQNKAMLYGQAVMDAIASEIAVVRSILATPSPGPMKIATAFAAGAGVLVKLMAQAKQIKNMGKNGSGASKMSAGYTSLNGAITGDRTFNYERQRQQNGQSRDRAQADATRAMSEDLKKLNGTLRHLKVTIDEPTMADVYRRGHKRVQKMSGPE